MHVDQLHPSRFIKSTDCEPPLRAEIDRVVLEEVGEDRKPVLYLKGITKVHVLPRINTKKITQLTGSKDTDDWSGTIIELYATTCEFRGDEVDCIRIRSGRRTRPTAPAPEEYDSAAPPLDTEAL